MSAANRQGSHLVVVGGGITGLAAAWEATRHGWTVTVLEAGDRVGGKIRTSAFAGRRVDEGADAFLRRVPEALDLCAELGLDDLVAPRTGDASVFAGGTLRPIPAGTVLGVPLDLEALSSSGVVSTSAVELARAEADHTGPPPATDVALGDYLRPRFGDEIVDVLVEPLVGGIYAGSVDRMSLDASTPQLADAAHASPSLRNGLAAAGTGTPDGPVFAATRGGMGVLVETLRDALVAAGVDVRTGSPVRELVPGGGGREPGVTVHTDGTAIDADAVVLACPARPAADALRAASPAAADVLGGIDAASVVLVTLLVDDDPAARRGSGFLVPRGEPGVRITACSWFSTKWGDLAGDGAILRVSLGHDADASAIDLDDDDVIHTVVRDLATTMSLDAAPREVRISRWRDGFPQYRVGHLDRMAAVDAALARDLPATSVAGASCRGIGIPACVRQGRAAARRLIERGR